MDFSRVELADDDQAFLEEVRAFLGEQVTAEVIARDRETGDNFDEGVHLALGARGYLTGEWKPESEGGFPRIRRRIWELEKRRAHVPWVTSGTTALVARSVERFGKPELKDEVMPLVYSGHARMCLGYTEPEGGSDIATCKTRAVRDGDEHGAVAAAHDGLADVSIMWHQAGFLSHALDTAAAKVAEPDPAGRRRIDDDSVAYRLGRSAALIEAALSAPSIFGRVAAAQTMRDVAPELMDILGAASALPEGADGAADDGAAEYIYRFAPLVGIYGGTLEVFRNMIAQHVLGLGKPNYSPPKAPRG
jgi:alkylation response protein AidB-like acyl-CoA dehydrogenase